MLSKSQKDMVFGLIVLAIGVAYLVMTMQLPRKGGIDSTTVPYILSILIIGLGVIQLAVTASAKRVEAPAQAKRTEEGGATEACSAPIDQPDYRTVVVTAVLLLLYVTLLDWLGFPLMSALYLFAQISVLTPSHVKRNYPLYAGISALTSLFVYYLFLLAFDIMLPDGELWWALGLWN